MRMRRGARPGYVRTDDRLILLAIAAIRIFCAYRAYARAREDFAAYGIELTAIQHALLVGACLIVVPATLVLLTSALFCAVAGLVCAVLWARKRLRGTRPEE